LIIITLNRATLLRRTLEGLARQSRKIDEIIVIDNGPTRETEEVVSASTARYVPEPRRGYGHARNRGLAEAVGAVIYFLDDDCVPEPDWSGVLWNILDSGGADLASGLSEQENGFIAIPGAPGIGVELVADVGVAGIHRLLAQQKMLQSARVLVVCAGMEGALPTVVGGLVNAPVIAVPTSVGYGASLGGIAALLGMLNTCAPNVSVVNIDNGFGAACIASLINHM